MKTLRCSAMERLWGRAIFPANNGPVGARNGASQEHDRLWGLSQSQHIQVILKQIEYGISPNNAPKNGNDVDNSTFIHILRNFKLQIYLPVSKPISSIYLQLYRHNNSNSYLFIYRYISSFYILEQLYFQQLYLSTAISLFYNYNIYIYLQHISSIYLQLHYSDQRGNHPPRGGTNCCACRQWKMCGRAWKHRSRDGPTAGKNQGSFPSYVCIYI